MKKYSVVHEGEVVAVGSKKETDSYISRMKKGKARPYCGDIGTKVQEKRPPINFIDPHIAMKAAAEEASKNRKTYVHFSKDGSGKITATDKPPKDQFFKQPSEGRAKLAIPVRAKPTKMKSQLWNGLTMQNFFRTHAVRASTTKWIIMFNEPCRKMTTEDQLDLMLAHTDTEYLVEINVAKQYLIIDNIKGNS